MDWIQIYTLALLFSEAIFIAFWAGLVGAEDNVGDSLGRHLGFALAVAALEFPMYARVFGWL